MIKLSIIITIYNVEKYISKCLESVFIQNVKSNTFEVIVVNDGTLDNSMSIVNKFSIKYPNLKIIEQCNHGLSAARNTGLRAAKGEYVWFVDSDDWITENCFEDIISFLKKYKSQIFITPLKSILESTGEINIDYNLGFNNIDFISGINYLKKGVRVTPIQIYIFNKFFLEKYNLEFMYGVLHEDLEFAPKALYFAKDVCIINRPFYNYLVRVNGSITSEFTIKRSEDIVLIIKNLNKFINENNFNYVDKYYFNRYKIACFYTLISNLNKIKDIEKVIFFTKKYFWFMKRLGLESILTFYPRYFLYGILVLCNYRVLFFYFNKSKWY